MSRNTPFKSRRLVSVFVSRRVQLTFRMFYLRAQWKKNREAHDLLPANCFSMKHFARVFVTEEEFLRCRHLLWLCSMYVVLPDRGLPHEMTVAELRKHAAMSLKYKLRQSRSAEVHSNVFMIFTRFALQKNSQKLLLMQEFECLLQYPRILLPNIFFWRKY